MSKKSKIIRLFIVGGVTLGGAVTTAIVFGTQNADEKSRIAIDTDTNTPTIVDPGSPFVKIKNKLGYLVKCGDLNYYQNEHVITPINNEDLKEITTADHAVNIIVEYTDGNIDVFSTTTNGRYVMTSLKKGTIEDEHTISSFIVNPSTWTFDTVAERMGYEKIANYVVSDCQVLEKEASKNLNIISSMTNGIALGASNAKINEGKYEQEVFVLSGDNHLLQYTLYADAEKVQSSGTNIHDYFNISLNGGSFRYSADIATQDLTNYVVMVPVMEDPTI